MAKVDMKYDLSKLHQMVKGISRKHVVKVGIFSNRSSRHGKGAAINNPTLGAIHEYGSITNKIPARSFLRMPLMRKSKEIGQRLNKELTQNTQLLVQGKYGMILKRFGAICEGVVREAFATRGFGSWKPNKPSTVKRKGSSAPLIDTGQLSRSVTSKVEMI